MRSATTRRISKFPFAYHGLSAHPGLTADEVKTQYGNQAQIMGRLRSLAMSLMRKTGTKNFQALIEKFADSPSSLEAMLKQANFL